MPGGLWLWRARQGANCEPAGENVYRTQSIFDEWMAEDRIAEDVEHVVSVICQGERMDYGIEMDHAHGHHCCAS